MDRRIAGLVIICGLLAGTASANAGASLEKLVKSSDLVVLGLAGKVVPGLPDPELKRQGIRFRIDTAQVVVIEVFKGDPALAKQQVKVAFPGFPKEGQLTIKPNDKGIWFLRKSDLQGAYEAKTQDRFRPADELGAVRRAVRSAAGVTGRPTGPVDKAELARKLVKELEESELATDRRNAAYQLGELGQLEAAPALIKALGDESPGVRLAADIALRKTTGHRIPISFQAAPVAERLRGRQAWDTWWQKNRLFDRKTLLARAAEASARPQPDFLHAVEGLAAFGQPQQVALFVRAYESGLTSRNERLLGAAAVYFGRLKDRTYVPRLAALFDGTHAWTTLATQVTAALSLGRIVGEDFGTGKTALRRAAAWWIEHRGDFR
jgi:hypothetical protein